MVKKYLNTNNLDCSLPLLKAKLFLSKLSAGDVLEVTAIDPTSWEDFASYAKISGNKLLQASKKKNIFIYTIEKK
ncbi:MAG: sulfurtransferase TusA family protein [SAR86 cluster bacterium]|jgi:tRNA 2-thiouridine synthesizing protein A|nr:sulfurtransferase TusA family protein [SAR86 cluster bacterium]